MTVLSRRFFGIHYVMHKKLEPHPADVAVTTFGNPWPRCRAGSLAVLQSARRRVRDARPTCHLVPSNQRPHSRALGAQRSLFHGKNHGRVHAVGEAHCGADHQARQSFGGHCCASGVVHLFMAGRGAIPGPFIALGFHMHNWLIDADKYPQEVAAQRWLFAGHRQR